MKSILAFALVMLVSMATAQAASTDPKTYKAAPYGEIVLTPAVSEKQAVALATKLLEKDLAEYQRVSGRAAHINARFIALAPDGAADVIIAKIVSSTTCGVRGCRTVILQPKGNNEYGIVFDTDVGRLFANRRQGQPYYDLLVYSLPMPAPGFAVHFWDDAMNAYKYIGISKFKK